MAENDKDVEVMQDDGGGELGLGSPPSGTQQLVRYAEQFGLFKDDRDVLQVLVQRGGRQELLPLEGEKFKARLFALVYERTGDAPSQSDFKKACLVLKGRADEFEKVKLSNRVARASDDTFWIDQGDYRHAFHVTPSGWTVEPAPVMFRRYPHQLSLPTPVSPGSGDAKRLLEFVSLSSEHERLLFLCSTVAALVPELKQPPLVLCGPAGSAKTSAAKLRRMLIDPSQFHLVSLSKDSRDAALALDQHFAPIFDNLSVLSDEQADRLSRASTGDSFTTRELYTNDGSVHREFTRPVTLTAVNMPTTKDDLRDRMLLIQPDRLDGRWRPDDDMEQEFKDAAPAIFGGMLDALAAAMKMRPSVKPSGKYRMASFAAWGCAIAEALGCGSAAFEAAMDANMEWKAAETHDEDPVLARVVWFVRRNGSWSGLPARLYEEVTPLKKPHGWPANAAVFGKRLGQLVPHFTPLGIRCTRERAGQDRRWTWTLDVIAESKP